jgi:hypothetical protein
MTVEMQNGLLDIIQIDNTNLLFNAMFFLAFTFYLIRSAETNTILSMIVIGGISWVIYGYIKDAGKNSESTRKGMLDALNAEGAKRAGTFNESHRNNVSLTPFSRKGKGFKYLAKNPILVEIAKDLEVMRIFNRGAYADMILLMDNMQKTYTYILSDRYEAEAYLPIFVDIGDEILEQLYQLILVLPLKFKHVYGVNSRELAKNNIERFILLRRKMTLVLESYAKKELGLHVVPLSLPKASDDPFSFASYTKIP